MKLKVFLLAALLVLPLLSRAQTVTNGDYVKIGSSWYLRTTNAPPAPAATPAEAPVPNAIVATPNTPLTVTTAPDGTVTIDSNDLLSFLPPKYKTLIVLLIALAPVFGRIYHSFQTPGANVGTALQSAFLGKNLAVSNEIQQLKAKTGLPTTPAPSQTPPTAAPPLNPPTSV